MPSAARTDLLFLLLALAAVPAWAQASADPPPAPASAPAPAAPEPEAVMPPPYKDWDAALGVTGAYRPRYPGAPRSAFNATPGFYLRYGRYTITNASGFATRRTEDVVRGLGVEMLRSDSVRVSLSLRYDGGRSESSSSAYAGLGNIHSTVRARAAASLDLQGPWRLGASWNVDALGRGNGGVGDVSGGWERHLTPDTLLTVGASLSLADQRYMQAYYGITPAQSVTSGYPAYQPSAGLRDVGFFVNLRHDIGRDWIVLGGASFTRLLGSAATSPITRARNGRGVSLGAARQF